MLLMFFYSQVESRMTDFGIHKLPLAFNSSEAAQCKNTLKYVITTADDQQANQLSSWIFSRACDTRKDAQ
jgi:hypothetical protein